MMDSTRSVFVVVPVFNELGNLERLFSSFRLVCARLESTYRVRFVLVDDGSSDGTPDAIERLSAGLDLALLRNPVNQGPGAAFGRAFSHLAPHLAADDWVLTLEGDNTSRRELIEQMFRRAEEGFDVVLASPYMYGGGITNTSAMRVLMSHMANAFVKELLGVHGILTMSSFFRLHRGAVLLKLQACYGPSIVERAGFECMVEMLLKMIYLGTTISEVAMLLDTSLRVGKSKMKVLRTIRGYVELGQQTNRWRGLALRQSVQQPAISMQPG
jgi:dolichol-phosphate mannosyltransferase